MIRMRWAASSTGPSPITCNGPPATSRRSLTSSRHTRSVKPLSRRRFRGQELDHADGGAPRISPTRWEIGEAPLSEVANVEKMMPMDFITDDGFGITQKCRTTCIH